MCTGERESIQSASARQYQQQPHENDRSAIKPDAVEWHRMVCLLALGHNVDKLDGRYAVLRTCVLRRLECGARIQFHLTAPDGCTIVRPRFAECVDVMAGHLRSVVVEFARPFSRSAVAARAA